MHPAPVHDGKAWRQGLALWFLLLSILTHAVVPAGSPLQRTSGSAFSATTAEVAIAPKRNTAETDQAELKGADEGSPDGAGAADPPPALAAGGRFAPPIFDELALLARPASAWMAGGGAAPFSARAPPSI